MGKKQKGHVVKFGLAGFARVQIARNGKLEGDSGWVHNVITDYGLDEGLAQVLASQGGSVRAAYAAIGTGTAPGTAATSLNGENAATNGRDLLSYVTVTSATGAGCTARFYGTFASTESRNTVTNFAMQNIGLYTGSAIAGSNLLCGATYAASTLNTNQDVNYTYEWRFQTTT
uniref:Uncharacterized protein n=1 Tax=viral metagenome TaxID=1070528 RepID=A0A6M3JVF7_9ZZZZ